MNKNELYLYLNFILHKFYYIITSKDIIYI